MRRSGRLAIWASGLTLSLATMSAQAGPPLICFPYQISASKSLPWKGNERDPSYDRSRVVSDTLDLLKSERSALVRMETLRRAAVYIGDDRDRATELLAKISWIAMDADSAGTPSAEAWFNAGYLAATFRQSGADVGCRAGVSDEIDGYAWVERALTLRPDDAAMQYGAALITHGHPQFAQHLRRAVAGARDGSDLARSIESSYAAGHKPLKELRAELGVDDRGTTTASKPASSGG